MIKRGTEQRAPVKSIRMNFQAELAIPRYAHDGSTPAKNLPKKMIQFLVFGIEVSCERYARE